MGGVEGPGWSGSCLSLALREAMYSLTLLVLSSSVSSSVPPPPHRHDTGDVDEADGVKVKV